MPMEEAAELTEPTLQLLHRAKECCAHDSGLREDDEFTMLCVRTRKYEMLLSAEENGAFAILVLQDPTPSQDQPSLVFEQGQGKRSVVRGGSLKPAAV